MTFQMIKIPRQTKFLQLPEEEVHGLLSEVERSFGTDFLADPKCDHRLQKLWERPDPNSTIELLSLGYALASVRKAFPAWLNGCLHDLKQPEAPKLNGPLFELNMVSWLINGGMQIEPAPYAYPGLDLTIKFADNIDLLVSLKNFDMSTREANFRGHCERLRDVCRKLFSTRGLPGVHAFFTAREYFDNDRTWESIAKVLENWTDKDGVATFMPPHWPDFEVGLFKFEESFEKLARAFVSDDIVAIMPWHENEHLHFSRKLNDAAAELKAATAEKPGLKACFIRIHQSADVSTLQRLATEIVSDPNSQIDLILLYQPAFVTDIHEETTTPTMHLIQVASTKWNSLMKKINLKPLIAKQIHTPSKVKLTDGHGSLFDLPPEHYFYCRGQHFLETRATTELTFEAHCRRVAGLSLYPVINKTIPVVGLLPQEDEYLIL